MLVRFLHVSDLHLGLSLSRFEDREELRQHEFRDAFVRAMDFAADSANAIDGVLISGDLFDSHRPDADSVRVVTECCRKLSEQNVPILMIPGNHDSYDHPGSIYKRVAFPGVHLFEDVSFGPPVHRRIRDTDCYFYGIAMNPYESKNALRKLKRSRQSGVHIALLHGSYQHNPEWDFHGQDFPIRLEDLQRAGMDYYALGHYHNFTEIAVEGAKAVYPGTLEGRKFGENGDRYLIVVEFDERESRVKPYRWNRRTFKEEQVNLLQAGIQTSEELITGLMRMGDQNTVLKVVLDGPVEFPIETESIEKQLLQTLFHCEIIDRTDLIQSSRIQSLKNERSIRGLFLQKLLQRIEEQDPDERGVYQQALKIGLSYFDQ